MRRLPIFGTQEALPPRSGDLWLTEVQVYDNPAAGARFSYRHPDAATPAAQDDTYTPERLVERSRGPQPDFKLVKADAYLYDLGLSGIPDDILSDTAIEIFNQALAEIALHVDRGNYEQFEVMTAQPLNVPPAAAEPAWLWAAMRYRQVKGPMVEDDLDRASHLAVRTDGGFINKVRYTYPAALPPSVGYSGFLMFLFEWRHSIQRVLAGGSAVPPGGDLKDPEWLRTVNELRTVSLPHPLWFFDPAPAQARQAELAADHLRGDGDTPERPLEMHEMREAIHHETAHSIFALLEQEMALEIETGGFGAVADVRTLPLA